MRKGYRLLFWIIIISFQFSNSAFSNAIDAPTLYLHRFQTGGLLTQTAVSPNQSIPNHRIIQFNGPISISDQANLKRTGVTILEYLPDFAYLVSGSDVQLETAVQLNGVYASYPFTLADKMSPILLEQLAKSEHISNAVQQFDWQGGVHGETAVFSTEHLWKLAANPAVRWLEPTSQPTLQNDQARQIGNVTGVWQTHQHFGAGQIVAIADTGLDTGQLATISPDFANRIANAFALVSGESWDDNHGHGTHVAGSLLGSGVQSGANPATQTYENSFAGMAPEAHLIVQGFEATAEGEVIGLDPDHYNLFDQAYIAGARIHSNSWGDTTGESGEAQYGGYPFGAQRTDAFVWEHPDMAIFFAAGNAGTDGSIDQICFDGDGVVDEDSLLSPGTAKNVITVGATENERASGGLAGSPWILLGCFFFPPIATDDISNNANGLAGFSSRGPTDDGRIKPDIVAPGTNILSNRSHGEGAGTLWGAHESNEHYSYSGGTSMATPISAGMGTLIREWLTTDQGVDEPTAALLKAVMLNTAVNIAPGQYGGGTTQEIPNQWPNSVAGWGRADLGFLTAEEAFQIWFDENLMGLQSGEIYSYSEGDERPLTITSTEHPLRIHLVWTDPPASLSAAKQLVNDLDLIITAPDGSIIYGNGIEQGDRLNNVEGVVIDTPQIGTYAIKIEAYQTPMGSQPYALVVSGALETDPDDPLPPTAPTFYQYLPKIAK